jgi:hypothetical protein
MYSTSPIFTICCILTTSKEASQSVIELKEDDPDALEALLRYIYTSKYIDDEDKRKDDWMFHLNYSIVAR